MRESTFFMLLMALVFVTVLVLPAAADNTTVTVTPTAVPTTIATTVATTVPTTIITTPATTVTTIVPTTVATTAPTTVATTITVTTSPITTTTSAAVVLPVAGFSCSPSTGTAPLAVQFTDTSINSPTLWAWDFGDGGTSTEEKPSHTYLTAGTYTITLDATNSAGTNSVTHVGSVTVSAGTNAPIASFTLSVSSGSAPLTVLFTDTSTNSPTSWSWDFGDRNTSTDESPSYTYVTAGAYTVTLTVTNTGGSNSATETGAVTVTAATAVIPVASFTESATTGILPLSVQFTDSSTNAPTSWVWDFGDGGTSTEENPAHIYSNPGTYTVSLIATNTAGGNTATRSEIIAMSQETVSETVSIQEPTLILTPIPETKLPDISITGPSTSGPAPLTVMFSAETPDSPEGWNWDFGDGGTSTEEFPSHTYNTPGTYTVTLKVKYLSGTKTAVKNDYVTVNGQASTSSPLSSVTAVVAITVAAVLSLMISGRKRR